MSKRSFEKEKEVTSTKNGIVGDRIRVFQTQVSRSWRTRLMVFGTTSCKRRVDRRGKECRPELTSEI